MRAVSIVGIGRYTICTILVFSNILKIHKNAQARKTLHILRAVFLSVSLFGMIFYRIFSDDVAKLTGHIAGFILVYLLIALLIAEAVLRVVKGGKYEKEINALHHSRKHDDD